MPTARKESRKKLMAFTPVYDVQHKKLLGYIADLTLKGAMVSGEKTLTINEHLTIRIEFSEVPPLMNPASIDLPARVAWCRPDEGPNFNIGFEFEQVSPENEKTITAVLERYQFRSASTVADL